MVVGTIMMMGVALMKHTSNNEKCNEHTYTRISEDWKLTKTIQSYSGWRSLLPLLQTPLRRTQTALMRIRRNLIKKPVLLCRLLGRDRTTYPPKCYVIRLVGA